MWKKIKKHRLIASITISISLLALLAFVGYVMQVNNLIIKAEEPATTSPVINPLTSLKNSTAIGDFDAPDKGLLSAVKFVESGTNYLAGLGLDDQGNVWSWGYNIHGQLGTGRPISPPAAANYQGGMTRLPYFADNKITIRQIAATYHASYAVDTQGNAYAWGRNQEGQLGLGGTDNGRATPVPISAINDLEENGTKIGVKKIFASTGISAPSFTYVLMNNGDVYAFGYAAAGRINGYTGYVSTPVKLEEFSDLDIEDMALGTQHGVLLTSDGKVYTWGNGGNGRLGHGNTTAQPVPKQVDWFTDNNIRAKAVSANDSNTVVSDSEGRMYQFGRVYTTGSGGSTNYNIPTLIEMDSSTSGYSPFITDVEAGAYISYAIDSHGRIWSWGYNVNLGYATDGPLYGTGSTQEMTLDISKGKLYNYSTSAKLVLQTLGDGDTQQTVGDTKAPVFSGETATGNFSNQFNNFRDFGVWSTTGGAAPGALHPTVYDKKYMRTVGTIAGSGTNANRHAQVYPLDEQDRRLVYVVRRENTSTPYTYSGNFYVASESYTGSWIVSNTGTNNLPAGVTEKTSVPSVKEIEASWIEASIGDLDEFDYTGNQKGAMPYIKSVSTFQSAVTMVDSSGNLYKQAMDGSGSVAWGWDFTEPYDLSTGGSSGNLANGLYNKYAYELMYMRGSPGISASSVEINQPTEKIYKSQEKTQSGDITIKLGAATTSEQLNITIEPTLTQAKYLIIPYANDDSAVINKNPSEKEFLAAYDNAASLGYTAVDLIDKHPEWDLTSKLGETAPVLEDKSISVSQNSVVWVYTVTSGYSANVAHLETMTYDNFYTDTIVNHKGLKYEDTTEVYEESHENVTKLTEDGIDDLIGFPIDKNGQIIGTPDAPPSFGYDEVKVERLTNEQLDEINPLLRKFWLWHTPQATSKAYTLNGIDADNSDNLEAVTGELPITTKYTHTFYYDENPDAFAKAQYIGVDQDGNRIPEFHMEPNPEKLMKETDYSRTPPALAAESGYKAIEYKVVHTAPQADPVNISDASKLTEDGSAHFNIPWDDAITEVTVIFIYERAPLAHFISADRGVTPYTAVSGFIDEKLRTSKDAPYTHQPKDSAIDAEYGKVGYKLFNGKVTDVASLDLTSDVQRLTDGKAVYTPPTDQKEYTVVYIYEKAPLIHYLAADRGQASNNRLTDFSMADERLPKDEEQKKLPVYNNEDYVAIGYKVIKGSIADSETTLDITDYSVSSKGEATFTPEDFGNELTVIFIYEKKTLVHFVGINAKDPTSLSFMEDWDLASRKEVKGSKGEQVPKEYKTPEEFIVIGYYIANGKVTDASSVDLTSLSELSAGKANYTVPTNQDEITIVFIYETPPSTGILHVRQVIVDSVKSVKIPANGFMYLKEGTPGSPWTYSGKQINIVTPSDKEEKDVNYNDYEVPLSKETMGYGLSWITPQYYMYKGYKISAESGEYNSSNLLTSRELKIDFNEASEYWVTIYLTPTTKKPGNYDWGTAINSFGKLLFKE